MDPLGEIIVGDKLTELLHEWIDSRQVCKMDIPQTNYGWFTLLLGIQKEDDSEYLLIDRVAGFEKAFSRSPMGEVSLEFLEKGGIRCQFKVRVIKCLSSEIRAELPETICRIQRRTSYRIDALSGTEITFHIDPEKEEKAKVKDYSLGGVAFFIEKPFRPHIGDRVVNIHLNLPQRKGFKTIPVPLGMVSRIEQDFHGKEVCAIEFQQFPEKSREDLWNHMVEMQRKLIQKIRKI